MPEPFVPAAAATPPPSPWDPARERYLAVHGEAVRRYCRSLMHNSADAEDAAQETFVRFIMYRGEVVKPEAWLITAARRACVDIHRRNASRQASELTADVPSAAPDPQDTVVQIQSANQLLDKLRDPDRDLLEKLYMRGLTVQQVARLLQVSPGNVRIMAMRARRRAAAVFGDVRDVTGAFAPVGTPGLAGAIRRVWQRWVLARSRLRSRDGVEERGVPLLITAGQILAPAAVLALLVGSGAAAGAPAQPGSSGRNRVVQMDATSIPSKALQAPASAEGIGAARRSSTSDSSGVHRPVDNSALGLVHNLVGPGKDAKQQDASFAYLTASPHYGQDRTVFASGTLVYGCVAPCATVFRSTDGGVTWQRLEAQRFTGGAILLPPDYPNDQTIFAVGNAGLQRSDDGGASFNSVVPGVTVAAIAADSAPHSPRVLVASQSLLLWYDAASGAISAGPLLPATFTNVTSIVFGVGSSPTIAGTAQDPLVPSGVDSVIARCTEQCNTVINLPSEPGMAFASSSTFSTDHAIIGFAGSRLVASTDGGQTFTTIGPSWHGILTSAAVVPGGANNLHLLVGWLDTLSQSQMSVSADGGRSFGRLQAQGLASSLQLNGVLALPGGRWLSALRIVDTHSDFGIRCSVDQGLNWSSSC